MFQATAQEKRMKNFQTTKKLTFHWKIVKQSLSEQILTENVVNALQKILNKQFLDADGLRYIATFIFLKK